jgi:hypothetical protein
MAKYEIAATTARSTRMNVNPEVIFRPIVNDDSFTRWIKKLLRKGQRSERSDERGIFSAGCDQP